MDLSAFVGKLLEEQDGDVLREEWRYLTGRNIAHVPLEIRTPVGPFVWFMNTSSR